MVIGHNRNRLANEKSPYLLQHASNPVDWYPWCDEAFKKAKEEDKPIFLSIGYSTCHWCHVMAKESFEDDSVASQINGHFIPIKVDREERPDIDQQYMTIAQIMARQGGWPLTIIMTPDKRPFFAATYLPKETRGGLRGLMDILPAVSSMWDDKRELLLNAADKVVNSLVLLTSPSQGGELSYDAIVQAYDELSINYDATYGGFGSKPKFPTPHTVLFLLRHWRRTNNPTSLLMAEKTLNSMREGGIFDHLGGGFHRYATDARWRVPHFEKMLYDQALLSYAYTEGYQATGNKLFESTVHGTLDYVLSSMQSKEGGFYSAEDADSEGVEGAFYTWTYSELKAHLSSEDLLLMEKVFSVSKEGNYTDEATGKKTGKNILYLSGPLSDIADDLGISDRLLASRIELIRKELLRVRSKRKAPFKDDKVLTGWNGLMIAALAKAGAVFERADYIEAARDATLFLSSTMYDDNGSLFHRYRDGHVGMDATLEDYAFFSWGLLELYFATWETEHIIRAVGLIDTAIRHFWDPNFGGFFFSSDRSEELLSRQKEVYDGAIPSGNSVMLYVLSLLYSITGDEKYLEYAHGILRAFSSDVTRVASGHAFFFIAADMVLGKSSEVVIVGKSGNLDTICMKLALVSTYLPHVVHVFRNIDYKDEIEALSVFSRGMLMKDGLATAYVCKEHSCMQPITDPQRLVNILEEIYSTGLEA